MKKTIDLVEHSRDLQAMWNRMHINPVHVPALDAVASRLYSNKARFLAVTQLTHVPWDVIAVIKEREAGADPDFLKFIGNGQFLNHVTTIVPKGRGPFATWDEGAYDALVNCAPFASRWRDWSIGGTLCLLEQYNGMGYAMRDVPSPYIWSYSDQYTKGKYDADWHYDPFLVDQQYGCAPLLSRLFLLDKSIATGPTSPNSPASKAMLPARKWWEIF